MFVFLLISIFLFFSLSFCRKDKQQQVSSFQGAVKRPREC